MCVIQFNMKWEKMFNNSLFNININNYSRD